MKKELKQNISVLIGKNKLTKVLAILKQEECNVASFENRLNRINEIERNRTESYDHIDRQKNRLVSDIQSYLASIPEEKITTEKKDKEHQKEVNWRDRFSHYNKELPSFHYTNSAEFFDYRISKAFPGTQGLRWFNNSKEAIERLKVLLKDPLVFKNKNQDGWLTPIWWCREGSANSIQYFSMLTPRFFGFFLSKKVLMNTEELVINKIAVYKTNLYYKNFVYVEVKPDKQTGLYNITEEGKQNSIDSSRGYSSEEFALLNKRVINREEYDDGAAVINGKVIDASHAELRVRYLTKYNFIIAANRSAFNVPRFERENLGFMNDMLKGNASINDLVDRINACGKHEILGSRFG